MASKGGKKEKRTRENRSVKAGHGSEEPSGFCVRGGVPQQVTVIFEIITFLIQKHFKTVTVTVPSDTKLLRK